eukprot:TRINITY_DN15051_c0_g1_i4.p1 TRINITY_DN15051_c0_g1~~TRINITY_DN15051_c0_g1_i4.p1  ORF type:complete len:291 (-),score=30.96 TRINITY_DN15051_c0_g1_i4:454-1326(-)
MQPHFTVFLTDKGKSLAVNPNRLSSRNPTTYRAGVIARSSTTGRACTSTTARACNSKTARACNSITIASNEMEGGATPSVMYSPSDLPPHGPGDTKCKFVDRKVVDYTLTQIREPEILAMLRKETETLPMSIMMTTQDIGQLLAMLVQLVGAKRGIEVGVYTGYSALSVLLVLPSDGKLVACDVDESTMNIARRYFHEAGVSDKVDVMMGDAKNTLQTLLGNGEANSYDYAFIDADKENYINYYELVLKLVRPGGVIVVDNVLWSGRVADPTWLTASDGVTLLMKRNQEE